MAGDFRRLVELGFVPLLAKEIAATIDAGTVSATAVRRLTELGMIPREIRELRNQLATPALRIAKRWTEIGVSPRLARELVTQMGGGAATVPAAPSVVITSGDTQNSVAWTDGSNGGASITAHKVYGSTTSGFTPGGGNLLYSGAAASPYVHTGLTNGTTWYYKVVATNSVGDSAASTQQAGTPSAAATAPAAPTLAVTAGNAQNSITWTDGSNGGSAITARKLYRSTTSGFTPGLGNLIATSPTFPYADTGLTNGTTYYYKGIATNAIGDSAASTEQSGAPSAGALWQFPSAFTNGSMLVSLNQTQASGSYTTNYSQATYDTNAGTTYYVRPTGNDTTGDGLTAGTAFREIQKAHDIGAAGLRVDITAGRYKNFAQTKNMSLVRSGTGDVWVGDVLAEADITWGAFSGGKQTATLVSSAVSGMVDTTKTRRSDRQTRAIPQVSQVATTAAGIATLQAKTTTVIENVLYGTTIGTADPQAGVFRSTPSQLGSSDARDLTGKADTEIIVWKATAARPLTLSSGAQLFAQGISFVGGSGGIQVAAGTRLVLDNCRSLGNHDQQIDMDGTLILYRSAVRGSGVSGADLIDYNTLSNFGWEIESFLDQCSSGGADNCSTQHNGTTARANSTYLDASRCWSDIGQSFIGGFGCIVGGAPTTSNYSINVDGGEFHCAGMTFIPTGATDIRVTTSFPTTQFSRGYFYDSSYAGKTVTGTITDRSGTKSTSDVTFVKFDPSNIGTLFKDTAGTVPVTTAGDAVLRINSTTSTNDYITVTGGTLTYQLDGSLPCLVTGTANALALSPFFNDAVIEEGANFLLGLKSSDTSGYLVKYASGTANTVGNYNTTTASLTGTFTYSPGRTPGAPTYNVDGSNTGVTTGNALKAAAFNGAGHVVGMRGVNLAWLGYYRSNYLLNTFDGTIYGIELSRATDSTNLRAREQAMATKSGATLV